MDIFSAIIVVVPLIVPMGEPFGIDPMHLGIVFLANLELGYLTPPVGMNLFLASLPVQQADAGGATAPSCRCCSCCSSACSLITYLPWLTTWLPGLFAGT